MSADDFDPQPMNTADAKHTAGRQKDVVKRALPVEHTDSDDLVAFMGLTLMYLMVRQLPMGLNSKPLGSFLLYVY